MKSPDVIERMRRTGRSAAEVLAATGAAVRPGITSDELDAICHAACIERGGYPSPLNYNGFPKSLCTSVNEVICHGIPDDRPLVDGDIVNLDVTLYREGVHGDTNATFLVGEVDDGSRNLVRVTRECLMLGIEAVKPGRPLSDIGRAIERHATKHSLGVVRAFIGHGIGEQFHTDLQILHYYDPASAHRHAARHDVHDRADDHDGSLAAPHVGRRVDCSHDRRWSHGAVRAHDLGHRRRVRDPHPRRLTAPHVPRIVAVDVVDVRFPTSDALDGSDAMHPDPDYSAAYVVLRTDARDADELSGQGHGLTFTIGRGTEVVCAAVDALLPMVVGIDVDELMGDLGRFARMLGGDSQLRWIGPEKGAIHLATAALVNAAWDLRAKREGKPLWRVLADLSPEALVELVDFTYLTDMVTPAAAVELLRAQQPHRADRIAELERDGYPAYTTSAGWLGYDDDKIRALCREAIADGFNAIKMKVGADLDDDMRRAALLRGELGPDRLLMTDANQRWDVGQAIEWMRALADQDPYWIEEPTSPDDVLGHATIARALAPMKVATGEHAHNRVMFKQLLQADAIGVCQVDSCRLGGVNEVLAVLLMAAVAGCAGVPSRGWGRAVRVRVAPRAVRLHRGVGLTRRPHVRVGRPPARALRRPGVGARWPVRAAERTRLRHHDAARVARALPLPRRPRVEGARQPRVKP